MKKLKLSPIQNQILRILEEAGEESLKTLLLTLHQDGFQDEAEAVTALNGLERIGLLVNSGFVVTLSKSGLTYSRQQK